MSAPGPVNNGRLFEKDEPKRLRGNLRLKVDYIGVNACVWCGAKIVTGVRPLRWLFMHVHGGGPAIVRDDLEIYSQAPHLTQLTA